MHSGSTLKQLRTLDRWFGAHQRIDRLARRELARLEPKIEGSFPAIRLILEFEGRDGPDGIKIKAPAQDEPWYFYDPNNPNDSSLPTIIKGHYTQLVRALKAEDKTLAAFQAAWLAHAVVDGLTPAHHYPYEEELERLRGQSKDSRNSAKQKLVIHGGTTRETMKKNWQMWGDKGLLATHLAFEMGVALVILPMRLKPLEFSKEDVKSIMKRNAYLLFFKSQAKRVSTLELYEQFYTSGWTPKIARSVRHELMPLLVESITLIWYSAWQEAKK